MAPSESPENLQMNLKSQNPNKIVLGRRQMKLSKLLNTCVRILFGQGVHRAQGIRQPERLIEGAIG